MRFNLPKTVALFVVLAVAGTVTLVGMGAMATNTVLMVVAPLVLISGAFCLAADVKYGKYRASN